MSKTQKRANGTHNPSPYMRRFQLPSLTFKDSSDYDELLSPLETEAKQQLMDEKNSQLRNYFADGVGTSVSRNGQQRQSSSNSHGLPSSSSNGSTDSESKLYEDPFEPQTSNRKTIPESRSFDHKKSITVKAAVPSKDTPPPVPPHRPNPRQKLVEIEKYRMCKEILELERRSREMYDILMSPPQKK